MSHLPEDVTPRYARRYSQQRFRIFLFSEFEAGEMMPDTIVYNRLTLAIALQQTSHALRNQARRLVRYLSP